MLRRMDLLPAIVITLFGLFYVALVAWDRYL
jgi:hypothetical protein